MGIMGIMGEMPSMGTMRTGEGEKMCTPKTRMVKGHIRTGIQERANA